MWIHAPPKKYRYGKFRFILLQSRREEYSPLCMRHRPTLKHIEGQKGHMIVMRRWKSPYTFIYDSQLAGGSWLYDSDPLGGLRGYRIFGAAATALTSGYSSSSSLDE